jgi:hypothetical protein
MPISRRRCAEAQTVQWRTFGLSGAFLALPAPYGAQAGSAAATAPVRFLRTNDPPY